MGLSAQQSCRVLPDNSPISGSYILSASRSAMDLSLVGPVIQMPHLWHIVPELGPVVSFCVNHLPKDQWLSRETSLMRSESHPNP